MTTFFQRRRIRKHAIQAFRHAVHVRHMREDVLPEALARRLRDAVDTMAARLKDRGLDAEELQRGAQALLQVCAEASPARSHAGLRENLEVIIVAVTVAMACRTYFVQPFKIPTGSMQPTLNGILHEAYGPPGLLDRLPLKLAKWAITGSWYTEVRVRTGGKVAADPQHPYFPMDLYTVTGLNRVSIYVGQRRYEFPREGANPVSAGVYLPAGTVLWSGLRTAGDHVFVDKVRWNFRRPKRGEVIVFKTDGIEGLPEKTHYIKRLVGLPLETVSIEPPYLRIDGEILTNNPAIMKIAMTQGYTPTGLQANTSRGTDAVRLGNTRDAFPLGKGQYFALGDNTHNSKDSRYWGAVPEKSLVGPGAWVYWPISGHWGPIR